MVSSLWVLYFNLDLLSQMCMLMNRVLVLLNKQLLYCLFSPNILPWSHIILNLCWRRIYSFLYCLWIRNVIVIFHNPFLRACAHTPHTSVCYWLEPFGWMEVEYNVKEEEEGKKEWRELQDFLFITALGRCDGAKGFVYHTDSRLDWLNFLPQNSTKAERSRRNHWPTHQANPPPPLPQPLLGLLPRASVFCVVVSDRSPRTTMLRMVIVRLLVAPPLPGVLLKPVIMVRFGFALSHYLSIYIPTTHLLPLFVCFSFSLTFCRSLAGGLVGWLDR